MTTDFCEMFCKNCTCSEASCKTYSYGMHYLAKNDVDYTSIESVLAFLKDKPPSRQGNVLTACKVYYKHVLKDDEKSE